MVAARGQPEGTEVEARESMNNGAAVGRGGDDTTCAAGTVLDDEVETHHRLAGDEGVAAGELGEPDLAESDAALRVSLSASFAGAGAGRSAGRRLAPAQLDLNGTENGQTTHDDDDDDAGDVDSDDELLSSLVFRSGHFMAA